MSLAFVLNGEGTWCLVNLPANGRCREFGVSLIFFPLYFSHFLPLVFLFPILFIFILFLCLLFILGFLSPCNIPSSSSISHPYLHISLSSSSSFNILSTLLFVHILFGLNTLTSLSSSSLSYTSCTHFHFLLSSTNFFLLFLFYYSSYGNQRT